MLDRINGSMVDQNALLAQLRRCRFVDLTHAFEPGIPHCPSFDPEERVVLYHYDEGVGRKGHGFLAHHYRLVGQWGTHVDPPAHFAKGLKFLDEIDVDEMLLSLVVIDITARAAADPDTRIGLADIHGWESRYGRIPPRSFVAKRTGWGRRWPDSVAMQNCDANGIAHFPGWSLETMQFLAHERGVVAIGHETTDTDAGVFTSRGEAPLEDWWLRQDKWQIELLANLDQVPASGALVVATWPKPKQGSGFPARVFAICPPDKKGQEESFR